MALLPPTARLVRPVRERSELSSSGVQVLDSLFNRGALCLVPGRFSEGRGATGCMKFSQAQNFTPAIYRGIGLPDRLLGFCARVRRWFSTRPHSGLHHFLWCWLMIGKGVAQSER